jgi:hypothetical protein
MSGFLVHVQNRRADTSFEFQCRSVQKKTVMSIFIENVTGDSRNTKFFKFSISTEIESW